MASTTMSITSILILFFLVNSSAAHYTPCSESFRLLTQDKNFSNCKKMTALGVEFGWEVSKHNVSQIDNIIGIRLNNADTMWLAWGLDP